MILIKNFYIDTSKGVDLIKIGHEVRQVVTEAKADNGIVTIMTPLGGAAVAVMEPDINVEEIKKGLEPLLANQLIRCLIPRSLSIPIDKGRMMIEPWQEIFLVNFESSGKRREFRVHLFTEKAEKKEGGM